MEAEERERETAAFDFEAGDHVTLSCNAGGVPYDHHAIVLSAGQESNGRWKLCISDFTADAAEGPSSVGSLGRAGVEYFKASSAVDESKETSRRGLRVLCVDSTDWRRVSYHGPDAPPVSPPSTVRRRVEFLLRHPHLIPSYSIVDSNCECVAVWCKTGVWSTAQARRWLGGTNLGSRIAVAGLSVASSVVAVPFAGAMLAAGVVAEVASGFWGDCAKRRWEERTRALNDAFDKAWGEKHDGNECCNSGSADNVVPSSRLLNPFSDGRTLRGMVDACQRADAMLAMANNS